MLGWLLAGLAIMAAAFFALTGQSGTGQDIDGGEYIYAVICGALVLLYLTTLTNDYRGRAATALSHAAIWLGLGLALVTAYAFRDEIGFVVNRVAGEVLPAGQPVTVSTAETGERSVRLRRHSSGHFTARTEINGAVMTLLVDTGASTVVLKPSDAEAAGIDVSALTFTVPVQTANGTTYAAPARLRTAAIGPIVLNDVEALVAQPGNLKESLLGMSFLRRLRSYEFSGDFLTIRD